jgi:CPA2 family monovalent cation:H+ antiporter-2
MMGIEFLKTLVIIFGVSATVVFLLHKFRVPSIVGFLIAGIFLGPHGFGFIQDIHEVELLAEVGVILLLFTIGLEISLKNLKRIRSAVLGGCFRKSCSPPSSLQRSPIYFFINGMRLFLQVFLSV